MATDRSRIVALVPNVKGHRVEGNIMTKMTLKEVLSPACSVRNQPEQGEQQNHQLARSGQIHYQQRQEIGNTRVLVCK